MDTPDYFQLLDLVEDWSQEVGYIDWHLSNDMQFLLTVREMNSPHRVYSFVHEVLEAVKKREDQDRAEHFLQVFEDGRRAAFREHHLNNGLCLECRAQETAKYEEKIRNYCGKK